jgi:hypothetical protein
MLVVLEFLSCPLVRSDMSASSKGSRSSASSQDDDVVIQRAAERFDKLKVQMEEEAQQKDKREKATKKCIENVEAMYPLKPNTTITDKDCRNMEDPISKDRIPKKYAIYLDTQCYHAQHLWTWVKDKGTVPHNRRKVTSEEYEKIEKLAKLAKPKQHSSATAPTTAPRERQEHPLSERYISQRYTVSYHVLHGPDDITGMSMSPDGRYIAYGIKRGDIVIRESTNNFRIVDTVNTPPDMVAVAWRPDGTEIAAVFGISEPTLMTCAFAHGRVRNRSSFPTVYRATSVAYSHDGLRVFVGLGQHGIKGYAHNNMYYPPYDYHIPASIVASDSGRKFAVCSPQTNVITVGELGFDQFRRGAFDLPNSSRVTPTKHMAWHANNRILAEADDKEVRVYDVNMRNIAYTYQAPEDVVIQGIRWLPNGNEIQLVLWNNDGSRTLPFEQRLRIVHFTPQMRGGAKKEEHHTFQGRRYKIHHGPKGGRYILVGTEKKKVYV